MMNSIKILLVSCLFQLVSSTTDGNEWPGIGSAAVAGNVMDVIHVFGGWDGLNVYNTHQIINVTSFSVSSGTSMQSARAGHTATFDSANNFALFGFVPKIELFASENGPTMTSTAPGGVDFTLDSHSTVAYGGNLFVFGGRDQNGVARADTWQFNTGSAQWSLIQDFNPVPARMSHTATVIASKSWMLVFGGGAYDADSKTWTFFDDLWAFDLITKMWVQCFNLATRPPARMGHASWFDSNTNEMCIWGGQAGDKFFNDMWCFSLDSLSWRARPQGALIPHARSLFASTLVGSSNLYVIGGKIQNEKPSTKIWTPATRIVYIANPAEFIADAWQWNGTVWVYRACLFNNVNSTNCTSNHQPQCDHCGHGYCIEDNVCICKGGWHGENCSINTCDDHRGYPSDLIDRIYIGELLVKAGRSLRLLKAKLEYIQARLPPFDELTTCQRYQPLSPIVMQSTARQSIDFYKNLTFDFKPIIDEFAKCILDV